MHTWLPTVREVIQFLVVANLSGKLPPEEKEAAADRMLLDSIVQIRRAQLGQPVSDLEPSTAEKQEGIADLQAQYLKAKNLKLQNTADLIEAGNTLLIPQVQALRDKFERESLSDGQRKDSLMRKSYAQRNFAAGLQILGTIILLGKDVF
jgi:hypothetical protein